jgi:hypothetical protein
MWYVMKRMMDEDVHTFYVWVEIAKIATHQQLKVTRNTTTL